MSASRSTSLEDFSIEEDGVSVSDVDECRVPEEDGVAIARPPRSAATSDEVIVSGQAALDVLNIVRLYNYNPLLMIIICFSYKIMVKLVEKEHQIYKGNI